MQLYIIAERQRFFNLKGDLDFRFLNLNDCILTHRDAAVLVASELYDYSIIGHIDNHAVEAAGCQAKPVMSAVRSRAIRLPDGS